MQIEDLNHIYYFIAGIIEALTPYILPLLFILLLVDTTCIIANQGSKYLVVPNKLFSTKKDINKYKELHKYFMFSSQNTKVRTV